MTWMQESIKNGHYVWMDGQYIKWGEANVHIMTHAMHYASSVFDGVRSYDGYLLALEPHIQRLRYSFNLLECDYKYSNEDLANACYELIKRNNIKQGYIRLLAWCGTDKITVAAPGIDTHVAIAAWERPAAYVKQKEAGLTLYTSKWRRPHPSTFPAQSKAASMYPASFLAKHEASRNGYDEAMLLDYQGNIAEASSSNLFFVIDGKLLTPRPTCFLNGITKQIVQILAYNLGIPCAEASITPHDLPKATEAFITGTATEITPIKEITYLDQKFTYQVPGPITTQLVTAFQEVINKRSVLDWNVLSQQKEIII